ncbi:MAG TPA: DUF6580 family putative transport protein [Lysobacter sp.]
MNRIASQTPAQGSQFAPGPYVLAALIIIAALTRLIPHPPNFSPIEAVALFGGAYFANRMLAVAVPLIAIFISDLVLGPLQGGQFLAYFHDGKEYLEYFLSARSLGIYACVALSAMLGFGLRGKVNGARVLGYSLAGSVLFFLVTNFVVWLTAVSIVHYPACMSGLLPCYVAALPFFQWTVLGTLFYSAILFGGFALLRQRVPALRAQTV